MSVEVHKLSKYYGSQKALDEVSFTVNPGEIVGLLGPNGAGKSTLMKIITCYLAPDSGQVRVNGHDILTEDRKVRAGIGYLPEHNPLYLDMYVKEFLLFTAGMYRMKGRVKKQRVEEMIARTGLDQEPGKRIGELSKGFRQRVGLAQALIHDPPVLILDEPTAGLDPNQIAEMRGLIRELGQKKTILFSTHIMQEAEALCDRLLVIHQGRIVADAPAGKLTPQGALTQVVRVQYDVDPGEEALRSLPGVTDLIREAPAVYRVFAEGHADIRPVLFRHAADSGCVILSLQSEEQTLEALFRQLTT